MIYPAFIRKRIELYREQTVKTANDTIDTVFKIGILALVLITFIWVSVFLYVVFYYTYVPSLQHVKPVNLQFESCEEEKKGICSYPTAHIQLTKSNQILMVGQPYRVIVELEMPESPPNKELGMFMVCGRLVGRGGITISVSCRSTMLRYYSTLVKTLMTFIFAPLYITGSLEEKQIIKVELFPHHEEDQIYPVTDVYIEIKSQMIEVYSSKLYVNAHLTGLRYLMFHWPVVSATFGITFNFCVMLFISLLSWWQLYGPYMKGREFVYEKLKEQSSPKESKSESEEEITTSSIGKVLEVEHPLDDSDPEDFMYDLKKLDASSDA